MITSTTMAASLMKYASRLYNDENSTYNKATRPEHTFYFLNTHNSGSRAHLKIIPCCDTALPGIVK